MISRIFRVGAEGTEGGKVEKTLAKLNIAVRDVNNQFRTGSEVIGDVAKIWNQLGNVQQVAVAQAIAG